MISSKRHNKYCLKQKKEEKGEKKLREMGPILIHLKKKAVLFLNSFPGPFCSTAEPQLSFFSYFLPRR